LLLVVVVATAATVPVTGSLLVLGLTVGPAAAAFHLAHHPLTALPVGTDLGLMSTALGIVLAHDTGLPIGFFSAVIMSLCSVVARLAAAFR